MVVETREKNRKEEAEVHGDVFERQQSVQFVGMQGMCKIPGRPKAEGKGARH